MFLLNNCIYVFILHDLFGYTEPNVYCILCITCIDGVCNLRDRRTVWYVYGNGSAAGKKLDFASCRKSVNVCCCDCYDSAAKYPLVLFRRIWFSFLKQGL